MHLLLYLVIGLIIIGILELIGKPAGFVDLILGMIIFKCYYLNFFEAEALHYTFIAVAAWTLIDLIWLIFISKNTY